MSVLAGLVWAGPRSFRPKSRATVPYVVLRDTQITRTKHLLGRERGAVCGEAHGHSPGTVAENHSYGRTLTVDRQVGDAAGGRAGLSGRERVIEAARGGDGGQGLAPARALGDSHRMSLYDLKTQRLDGTRADLGEFRGKVALVVNVASECGFTPQYAGLQKLHEELAGEGLAVLAFPSNEFGGQEPGTPEQIRGFCDRNYGVTFPLFARVETKPGAAQSPVYTFLTRSGDMPSWNFCKYLVGKDGEVRAFFPSTVAPEDRRLRNAVAEALAD
jgi:glutathione peroxidase